ncbi:Hypothetical Protein XCAW_04524 [Xanthomonas citri subsp. citri Aw12879]|nr:Hypothetical Protein XCAW_04524 [Xanthomonas citri subsp. citri Aw12879]
MPCAPHGNSRSHTVRRRPACSACVVAWRRRGSAPASWSRMSGACAARSRAPTPPCAPSSSAWWQLTLPSVAAPASRTPACRRAPTAPAWRSLASAHWAPRCCRSAMRWSLSRPWPTCAKSWTSKRRSSSCRWVAMSRTSRCDCPCCRPRLPRS